MLKRQQKSIAEVFISSAIDFIILYFSFCILENTIVDFFMKSDNEIMTKINDNMVALAYGFSSAMAWIYFIVCIVLIGISSAIISKVVYNYD